jgi:hypothetical protein
LRKCGFSAIAAHSELRAPGNLPLDELDLRAGYNVRTYDRVRRPSVLLDALNRCYEGLWGHHSATALELEDWLQDCALLRRVDGPAGLYALNPADGSLRWRQSLPLVMELPLRQPRAAAGVVVVDPVQGG